MKRHVLTLLALLALATLAGCAHSEGTLEMTSVDDATLADEASLSVEGDESRYDLTERRLAQSAVDDGSALVTDTEPPFDPSYPVAYDERYYELTHDPIGNQTGLAFRVGVDYNASDASGDRIDYESLPRVDRHVVRPMLVNPYDEGSPRLESGTDTSEAGTYTDVDANRSVLVDDQEYDVIVYEGRAFPIDVRNHERVELTTYRYEAETVAESPEEYGSLLEERYAFTLSNLTEDEQSVLEEAIDDAYHPISTEDEEYAALLDRFLDQRAVRKNVDFHSGSWVARYQGQLYWVEMTYGEFVNQNGLSIDHPRDPIVGGSTQTASATERPTESPLDVTPIEATEGSSDRTTATDQ